MCVSFMKGESQVKLKEHLGNIQKVRVLLAAKGSRLTLCAHGPPFSVSAQLGKSPGGLPLNHLYDSGCFNNSEILIMAEALHHQGMDV